MAPEQKAKLPVPPAGGKAAAAAAPADAAEEEKSGRFAFLSRIPGGPKITILLFLVIVGQGFAVAHFYQEAQRNKVASSPEVTLGEFQFLSRFATGNQVNRANFSLHIALLDQLDRQARNRLVQRKFRVLQNIEELLRKTPSGDFDDPMLVDLKLQLQERINQTLELKVIADVIITDLTVEHKSAPERKPDHSVGSVVQATSSRE